MTGPITQDQALLIAEDIKTLRNSVAHLEKSVEELKEAHLADPDPVYKEAIQENIVTISKQRARLAALESQAQLIDPGARHPN